MRDTITDRDYYRKETQRLIEKKLQLETEKMHALQEFRNRLFELEKDLKAKNDLADEIGQ